MTYEEKHLALITYLKVKVQEHDWHAVSDAANDLRVMEAEHSIYRTMQLFTKGDPNVDSR